MSAVEVELAGLRGLRARVAELAELDGDGLLERLGDEIVGQMRSRLVAEKTAPGGARWAPRADREPHPLLVESGALLESLQHVLAGGVLEVGSDLPYARIQHQRRPFLGLSQSNRAEVERVALQFLAEAVGV